MFEAKIEKGGMDGDKISFLINMGFERLTQEGTVAGDALKLNVTGPNRRSILLNSKRQKQAARGYPPPIAPQGH
jgi:hypothetical protein